MALLNIFNTSIEWVVIEYLKYKYNYIFTELLPYDNCTKIWVKYSHFTLLASHTKKTQHSKVMTKVSFSSLNSWYD